MAEIIPFTVQIPDDVLQDLSERLHNTRWPEAEPVTDWSQGTPLTYVRELCEYWADVYNWRAREALLNEYPQYRTDIDGVGIHFIHVPSPEPDALPLVLTHGWPGSVIEFLDVVGPLSDPSRYGGDPGDAFHVVCPSLPGYGFSDKPSAPGWGVDRIAAAWGQLMAKLGYTRYGAQGGDWGSAVSTALTTTDPEHLVGIHLNMVIYVPSSEEMADIDEHERAALTMGFGLREHSVDPTTDARLRTRRLPCGAVRLDTYLLLLSDFALTRAPFCHVVPSCPPGAFPFETAQVLGQLQFFFSPTGY